jgi:glycosyltransferase involved in cell wall biosynthesis
MSKIGVLLCAYNMAEYLDKCLSSWIFAKKDGLGGNEFIISAVSASFAEYKDAGINEDNTKELLLEYYNKHEIDYLSDNLEWVSEKEARNAALKPLLQENCDAVVMVDADEFFSINDIENIFNYVSFEKWISSFAISYKNFVFNENTYLKEPFQPNRIWRVNTNGYKLVECVYDNNMAYSNGVNLVGEDKLPHKKIPPHVAWVPHFTWMDNEKSKHKQAYQRKRWGLSGYKWNEEKNCLEFDVEYYKKTGQKIPETITLC